MSTGAQDNRYEIARLLQAGDPQALDRLFEYAPRLEYGLIRKFGAFLAQEDIEDLVMDGIINAFEMGNRYEPTLSSVATWLNRRVHYEALTFLRKRQHISSQCLDDLGHRLAEQLETGDQRESEQPSDWMDNHLQQLTPSRESVVRLFYYEGFTIEQIAKMLGISTGAVQVHLHRARGDLRGLIKSELGDDE
jgi:RNA polymerase sigma-70 factor (ECF subfamily)